MKRKIFILTTACLAVLIVLSVCKKKNTTENNPPDTPSAPQFTSEENLIGDKITFKVSATDPDGDSIAARFDWGDGDTSGWSDFVASGETLTGKHSYDSIKTYGVRAQIEDNKEVVSAWSEAVSIEIQDSAWTLVWTCATASAPWSQRFGHTSVVFDNKIWVLGGLDEHSLEKNDIWFSSDGVNWTCATESAQWSGRVHHTSVIFDNKIWIIGGHSGGFIHDVWYSSDGVNWTCATGSAGWRVRDGHSSVVFDNKIWVIGGRSMPPYYNDAWYSSDGLDWICVIDSARWLPRALHTSVVFDNKIWILGGETEFGLPDTNDVWFSDHGQIWHCATKEADWPRRCGHTTVVFDDKVWVIAGLVADTSGDEGPSNDVWFSRDSTLKNWKCLTNSAPWHKREYFTSVVFDNKIWVIGGLTGGPHLNDVWYGEIVHGKR